MTRTTPSPEGSEGVCPQAGGMGAGGCCDGNGVCDDNHAPNGTACDDSQYCTKCHDSSVYTRKDHFVTSREALVKQVTVYLMLLITL